jgi:hypothetical protein
LIRFWRRKPLEKRDQLGPQSVSALGSDGMEEKQ